MDLADALAFARTRREGALVTLKRDGRAQLSNILYLFGDDGVIRISVTDPGPRRRTCAGTPGRRSTCPATTFWAYVVLDGTAELSAVAARPRRRRGRRAGRLYRVGGR